MTAAHPLRRVPWRLSGLFAVALLFAPAHASNDRLTSRARPTEPEGGKGGVTPPLPVGEEVRTATGQRRRVALPDGSVLYVNQQTNVKLTAARRLKLNKGEVLVEAVPGKAAFVVETPKREVSAVGTAFAVRVTDDGTGIVVTRGKVKVRGIDEPLHAGQQLAPGKDKPETAPRATHLLGWARELMAEAESPLIPDSEYAGGSLIAIDPDGQEAKLSLRKYHVDVHIEDGFARTTIDQTYFNHHHARLEGTFRFPLPADASLSRLAMYVDGTRMEGGMVERDYGRVVYESIVHSQRDPALLEWVDGTTFKMRVFPLEARQEKRIILSYVQKLPVLYGQSTYRFPAGHSLERVRDWSLFVRVKGGADTAWNSASHSLEAVKEKNDLVLRTSAKNVKLDRDVVLTLSGQAESAARFSSFEPPHPLPLSPGGRGEGVRGVDGAKYLMVRHRPDLPAVKQRQRRDWVFLFESSGDREPLLARAQVEVIRGLLRNAEPDDTFAVIAAGTRVQSPMGRGGETPPLQPATPENVERAIAFLEQSHLIGALNLERALDKASALLKGADDPWLVHVGSGVAAMGEQRQDVLVKMLPDKVRYVGVGVGRRWNRGFMKAAAERGGGHFTQINPDEPISWRAFELSATLNTPRLLDLSVSDDNNRWLIFTSLVAHGEEVCAVARLEGGELPKSLTVRGTHDGQRFERKLPVRDVENNAGYLPRTWAKLEIERLLAEDAAKHKDAIIALSKAMYVMTPFTSLLVLESEAMYQQYKVERGRKDHWATYDCPEKIPVVYEPEDGQPGDPKKGIRPSRRQVLTTIPPRVMPRMFGNKNSPPRGGTFASDLDNFNNWSLGLRLDTYPTRDSYLRPAALPDLRFAAGDAINSIGVWKSADGIPHVNRLVRVERGDRNLGPERWTTLPAFSPDGRFSATMDDFMPSARVGDLFIVGNSKSRPTSFPRADVQAEALSELGLLVIRGEDRELTEQMLRRMSLNSDPALVAELLRPMSSGGETGEGWSYGWGDWSGELVSSGSLLYRRPSYSGDERLFYDLVAYAPGMSNGVADVLAVLEAEAAPSPSNKAGQIDDGARKLFDRATQFGRRTYLRSASKGDKGLLIHFDDKGYFAYERTLPPGIRERVICDGDTLWHLYPDLGIGAKRDVTRFHRLALWRLVPYALPRPEDLARGADLRLIDKHTVAVVPHGVDDLKDKDGKPVPYVVLQLNFDDKGRPTGQRVVEMPSKKVLARVTLTPDGVITVFDDKGKAAKEHKGRFDSAEHKTIKADVKGLVVLPLPYRSREHVLKARKLKDKQYREMPFEDALALFAADFGASNSSEALSVFRQGFYNRNQRQIGFYVLLAACGQNLDAQHLNVLREHLDDPLAQYLALHSSPVLRQHASQWAVGSGQWGKGFLGHLAVTHALLQRWQNVRALGDSDEKRKAELDRAAEYVRRHKESPFSRALLCLMQDRVNELESQKKDVRSAHALLAELWGELAEVPGLKGVARYEQARCGWKAGQDDSGRSKFLALYREALKRDGLSLIDEDFRRALLGDGKNKDEWNPLLRETAKKLIADKKRPAVLALVRQCWQLGDQPLAKDLLALSLEGVADEKEHAGMTLAAVRLLKANGDMIEADRLLQPLLSDKELSKRGALWRLAAQIAEGRDLKARQMECLERALDAEFRDPPAVINTQRVAQDYSTLLGHYEALTDAMQTLKVEPPADFAARVVRAADRWRGLVRDDSAACDRAARILRKLGDRELAWDYLTTPVGMFPGESAPWAGLAQTLRRTGELALADEAFAAAFAAEPTNAQLLWDRAQNLRQAGKLVESRKLLRQLADGAWQPRFQSLQSQARWQLKE